MLQRERDGGARARGRCAAGTAGQLGALGHHLGRERLAGADVHVQRCGAAAARGASRLPGPVLLTRGAANPNAVDGGEQAVLFDRLKGVLPETSGEGTHFLVPWLQKAIIFDIRTRPRSISSVTGTKGATRRAVPRRACAPKRRGRAAAAPVACGDARAASAARAGRPDGNFQCPRLALLCAHAARLRRRRAPPQTCSR